MNSSDLAPVSAFCADVLLDVDEALAALPAAVDDVVAIVRSMLGDPPDLVVRSIAGNAHIMFFDTTVDHARLEQAIVRPVAQGAGAVLLGSQTSAVDTYGAAVDALLGAKVLLVRPSGVLAVAMDRWPKREPDEPPSEVVPQGPHDGFVEVLSTNVALVRHRVPDPRLRWDRLRAGTRSSTAVALMYVQGVARPELVRDVRSRLHRVRLSFATDTSMVQEWLTNVSGWLFPTMQSTERPDVAAAALLEGRVAVLMDGSPVAVLAPTVFAHIINAPADYYNRSLDAVIKRSVRFGALLATLTVSPMFVALVTVNQELLPGRLAVSIAQSRLGVPLPVVAEVLLMEVVVEVLREASLRMPGPVGQSISVVGAVVIGQSAVVAGLISAPVVVVVALSYIAASAVPSLDARVAIRALRFPLIFLAAFLGLFGLVWGLMILFVYLLSLESFGVPYLAPVAPRSRRGLQDVLRRVPLTDMRRAFTARRGLGAR